MEGYNMKKLLFLFTAALVINDRTYISLRAVGEALGCEVEWE